MAGLNLFDILCLGTVVFSCLIGSWRGLAFEVLSLLAWAGAFWAAQWGSVFIDLLWPDAWLTESARAQHLLGFLLIFITTLFLLGLLASEVRACMKKTALRAFDRILGTGFGLLRAVLLLWTLTVIVWLTPLHQQAWWQRSHAAPWLDDSLRAMAPLLPASLEQGLPPALRELWAEH